MKKSKLLYSTFLSLFTLTTILSCQNDELNNIPLDQQTQLSENTLAPLSAQGIRRTPVKHMVKITVRNRQDAEEIESYGIDIFGSGRGGRLDAYVTDKEIEILKSLNVQFTLINSFNAKGGLPAGYHNVQQVLGTVREYAGKYPAITSLIDIGDSWEKVQGKSPNNDIWALVVTNKQTKKSRAKSPTILFMSGMHSRELAPVEVNLKLMDLILSNYGKDPQITQFVDTREIVFVPVANIDGRIKTINNNNEIINVFFI